LAGLSVGVPAKVDGVEAELAFAVSKELRVGALLSYANGKISNARVPCSPSTVPTVAAIQNGNPTGQVLFCTVNQRASYSAPFSTTLNAQYEHAVTKDLDGFIRALVNVNGASQNIPSNTVDNVPAYALANLYAGIRSASGNWEVTAYVKNLFDTKTVLERDDSPQLAPYATLSGLSAGASNYALVNTQSEREIGVTVHYTFGAR
jgi:iron complex outermembrane receptor protein